MKDKELLSVIAKGEDSKHQFKSDIKNAESLGAEMVALSNASGGLILIGVNDDGSPSGLDAKDVVRINQLISNAATENVRPPVSPATENISLPEGVVIAVTIEPGVSKPYQDAKGQVWSKSGADKRRVTAREELQRMFQQSGLLHGDEIPVEGTSTTDINQEYFEPFFERYTGKPLTAQEVPLENILENIKLMKNGQLTIAGTLLLTKEPQYRLPAFIVKAVSFPGKDITDTHYIDSKDINGKMSDIFSETMRFVLSNIHYRQNGQSFNSIGIPEIPRIVLEELIANALIHRDYFVSAPIRILVFVDRVEIISPGHLPNNLTVEDIKRGNSNLRNPTIASFAPSILPYRGLGSGILRALQVYPDIEFVDDRDGNIFKSVIKRTAA